MKYITLFALLATCAPAYAQNVPCFPREEAVEFLNNEYNEAIVARALTSQGLLFELLVNEETGSYSVLLTRPTSVSCLVNAGSNFAFIDPETGEPM